MTREKNAINRLIDAKEGYKEYLTDEAIDIAIEAIEQTRWIPVSEKLPKEGKEVLTCSNGGFIEIQSLEDSCADIYWENQKGDWTNIDEVIAWMPLPTPYKPQERSGEE